MKQTSRRPIESRTAPLAIVGGNANRRK